MTSHLEDYLETIYFIIQEQGEAHAAEVAQRMKVTRASVTGALRSLSEKGMIHYIPYKTVTLTELGLELAKTVAERHHVLHSFLRDILGVGEPEAEETACSMEHSVSTQVMDRLIEFIRFFQRCSFMNLQWDIKGRVTCDGHKNDVSCDACKILKMEASSP